MEKENFIVQVKDKSQNLDDFTKLSYLLRRAVRSSLPELKSFSIVSNPKLKKDFEHRSKDLLTVESWVNIDDLEEGIDEKKIASEGFIVPKNGLKFVVGSIHLNAKSKKEHNFCLCKICIGRAFCHPKDVVVKNKNENKGKYILPEGFDSILLDRNSGKSGNEKSDISNCHYEYLVFEPSLVLPLRFVKFDFDTSLDENSVKPVCENCTEKNATVFCSNCSARLCDECDSAIHPKKSKILAAHHRGPIKSNDSSFCPVHPHMMASFYCPQCKVPVCIECKMNGNHSSSEASNHILVGMKKAYQNVVDASKDKDPELDAKKKLISSEMVKVGERIKEVDSNEKKVELELYQRFNTALIQLRMESEMKRSILKAEKLELNRLQQEVSWTLDFISHQREMLNTSNFIETWNSHIDILQDLRKKNSVARKDDVFADMEAAGVVFIDKTAKDEKESENATVEEKKPKKKNKDFRKLLFEYEENNDNSSLFVNASEELISKNKKEILDKEPPKASNGIQGDYKFPYIFSPTPKSPFIKTRVKKSRKARKLDI